MNENITVKVRSPSGEVKECTIELSQSPPWKLVFSGMSLGRREFSGDDLFNALIALRIELEGMGVQLLCSGARIDVFPSAMSRQMGGARKAYVTRLKRPGLPADLVDIFDYSAPESVGSVAQQKAFHDKWFASLRP